MQVTKTETGCTYHVRLSTHKTPLQIHIADNVIPNLCNSRDCVAALVFWASQIPYPSIQHLKIASRIGSSLVSVEAYAQVGDPIDQMLFVLLIEKGEWDYCSPAQIPFRNIRQVATTLITALAPYLLGQRKGAYPPVTSLQPSLG